MRLEKNIADRKVLATRMEELTGLAKEYTGVPRCAYIIGPFSVERDGHVEADDGSLNEDAIRVLKTLIDEGMVTGDLPGMPAADGSEETAGAVEEEGSTEEDDTEAEDDEELLSGEATGLTTEEETDTEAGETGEAEADGAEPTMTAEEFLEENGIETTDLIKPNIAFPMAGHSPRSIHNLLSLLYSRGALISKATDGEFGVTEGLIEKLKDGIDPHSIEKLRESIEAYESENGPAIKGLTLESDRLVFTGFPVTANPEEIQVFMQLAGAMNMQAIEQNRIQSKDVDDSNEKYAMRTWLIRIGMKGADFKKARTLLMERLSGHTAFRTEADAERWKEKQRKKRLELKAAKEAAQAEENADAQTEEEEV